MSNLCILSLTAIGGPMIIRHSLLLLEHLAELEKLVNEIKKQNSNVSEEEIEFILQTLIKNKLNSRKN
jgi:hypothetical protein